MFSVLMDAKNCNPNGDPDANNEPRTNPWGYGRITDTCFKRMVREASVLLSGGSVDRIFMLRKSTIVDDVSEVFRSLEVKPVAKIDINDQRAVQLEFCRRYIDVRWFGGMLNANSKGEGGEKFVGGQLKGSIQIMQGESIDPISIVTNTITRSKKTNSERDKGNESEMGSRSAVDYGLYRFNGIVSPHNSRVTRLTYDDLREFFRCVLYTTAANLTGTKTGIRLRRLDIWVSPTQVCDPHKPFESLVIPPVYNGSGPIKYPQSWDDYANKIKIDAVSGLTHYFVSDEESLKSVKFSADE